MFRCAGFLIVIGGLGLFGGQPLHGEPEEAPLPALVAAKDSHGDLLPPAARLRLGTIRLRHGGQVTSVRYLPDGKTLMSYGNDQVLRYWDVATGKELHTTPVALGGNDGGIQYRGDLQFQFRIHSRLGGQQASTWCISADGRTLASIEGGNSIQVRDLMANKVVRTIKLEQGSLQSICFSPDGSKLGAVEQHSTENGAADGSIKLWDVATGKELRTLVGPKPEGEGQQRFTPYMMIFSPDGKRVVGLGTEFNNNNRMRIWDLTGNREAHRLVEHSGTSNLPVFSPDSKLLAEVSVNPVTGGNAKLRLWNVATGKQVRELGDMANGSNLMLFSPDGKVLAAVEWANNQAIHLYETATGKEIINLAGTGSPPTLLFSPDSKTLALGSSDQTIRLHEAASGKELRQLTGYLAGGGGNGMDSQGLGAGLAFSTDGKTIAAIGGTVIRRWSVETGKEVPLPGGGHEAGVVAVAVSPDGKTVATASTDGVRLWDAASGLPTRRLPEPAKGDGEAAEEPVTVNVVRFTPDGKSLMAGEQDGTITQYELASGKVVRQFQGHEGELTTLDVSSNGKLLVSAGWYDGRVFGWDAANGKQVRQFAGTVPGGEKNPEDPQRGSASLALAPDGGTIVTSDGAGVRVCEVATGKVRRQLTKARVMNLEALGWALGSLRSGALLGDSIISNAAPKFAPDGRTLATVSGSVVCLWDTARGKELRQMGGQGSSVRGVAFTPNGKMIAAVSEDGTVRFWDVATGTVIAQVEGHRGGVATLAFSADGQTLVTAGNDTTALVWDLKRCLEGAARPVKLTARMGDLLWARLADDDGSKAGDSMWDLIDHPDLAVPILRDWLRPVPPLNKKRVAALIADLEADSFDVRKKANEELEKLVELAEPALQTRLEDNPPLEVKQRIDKLLERLRGPVVQPDQARALRAVEVLARIGTSEARQVLERVAQGTPESRVTQRAKEALERRPEPDSGNP